MLFRSRPLIKTKQTKIIAQQWLWVITIIIILLIGFTTVYDIHELSAQKYNNSTIKLAKMQIHKPKYVSNLFGRYNNDISFLPSTHLDFKLKGTMVYPNSAAHSYALIDTGSITKIYHLNEELPYETTLTKVEQDRVILKNHNRLEYLKLPIKKLSHGNRA